MGGFVDIYNAFCVMSETIIFLYCIWFVSHSSQYASIVPNCILIEALRSKQDRKVAKLSFHRWELGFGLFAIITWFIKGIFGPKPKSVHSEVCLIVPAYVCWRWCEVTYVGYINLLFGHASFFNKILSTTRGSEN